MLTLAPRQGHRAAMSPPASERAERTTPDVPITPLFRLGYLAGGQDVNALNSDNPLVIKAGRVRLRGKRP